jgi:hypothetical protein
MKKLDIYKEYFIRNRVIIIYSVILAIICYGYELFNFSFSIDEEYQSFQKASDFIGLIKDGRWGTYYFNLLFFPHSLLPYLPTLIAILSIATSSFLFVNSEKVDIQSKIIFSTIFISYPLHSYYLEFNILNAPLAIGMVFSVLSYLLVKKTFENHEGKTFKLIASILTLTLSFSFYQALLPVYILLVLIHLLMYILTNESVEFGELFKRALNFFMVFCFAFLIFKIVDICLNYFVVPELRNSQGYTDHFWLWGKMPVGEHIFILFQKTICYFTEKAFYGAFAIQSLFLLVPFLFLVIFIKVKGKINKMLAMFILGFAILTPFLVMYVTGSYLPPRSLVALPFLLAAFWFLTSQFVGNWIRKAMVIIALLLFFNNTYYTTRLFYSSYVAWQADRDMANRIIERIYQLDLPDNKDQISVAFIGGYKFQKNELFLDTNDPFGASFFSWDNGTPHRMNALFKSIGIDNLIVTPKEQIRKISDTIDQMPCWPRKGSVALSGEIVVVKLSELQD